MEKGKKAPAWLAAFASRFDGAMKRLEKIEQEKIEELRVISDLQRRYQQIVEAAALGAAHVLETPAEQVDGVVLRAKLDKLTIKRHAVLTATLAGVGYQELAEMTGWDVTTVKLQLRAALQILGILNRETLLVSHKRLLDGVPEKEYRSRFGISKRWWLEQDEDLMKVLRTIKPPANQHIATQKPPTKKR